MDRWGIQQTNFHKEKNQRQIEARSHENMPLGEHNKKKKGLESISKKNTSNEEN